MMIAERANRVVVALICLAGVLPLLGTTVFKSYAALCWGLAIMLMLTALGVAIPRTAMTQQRQRRTWLLILGALALCSFVVFFLVARL